MKTCSYGLSSLADPATHNLRYRHEFALLEMIHDGRSRLKQPVELNRLAERSFGFVGERERLRKTNT